MRCPSRLQIEPRNRPVPAVVRSVFSSVFKGRRDSPFVYDDIAEKTQMPQYVVPQLPSGT
jgi:hypothetical protein